MAKKKKSRSMNSGDSLGLFQGSRQKKKYNPEKRYKKDKHYRDKPNNKKTGPCPKANIGWLFAKNYYSDIVWVRKWKDKDQADYFAEKNHEITGKRFSDFNSESRSMQLNFPDIMQFSLTTQYPGLVTGSGIPHESDCQGEIIIGFSFDYTTGLPVIPGSSVKGVLRSAFQQTDGEYIRFLLDKENKEGLKKVEDVAKLEKEIFDGIHIGKEGKETAIPVYERDIFFDAVMVNSGNENGLFLGEDFITPHPSPFKDPVPLLFLKVLPRVTFSFRFRLSTNKNTLLKPEKKLKLFEDIIRDLGIGAKTNTGYGKFS